MQTRREQKAAALVLVNEGIRQVAQDSIGVDLSWDFFCECGAPDCEAVVQLTLAAYAAIHDRGRSVLAAGHRLDQRQRTRRLGEDAAALQAQAEQQARRAGRNTQRRSA